MNKDRHFKKIPFYKINSRLVEIFIAVSIIILICFIAYPFILKMINKAREDVYKINEQLIIVATKNYIIHKNINIEINNKQKISIDELVNNNLMDKIYSYSHNPCSGYVEVTRKSAFEYIYQPYLKCDDYETK
jgi:type II secretory pathway pseudopilin PulG